MLQNAYLPYLLAKFGTDTDENEPHVAKKLIGNMFAKSCHVRKILPSPEVFKPELVCYFGMMLDPGCDGLPANEERGADWESICLDGEKEYFDACPSMEVF